MRTDGADLVCHIDCDERGRDCDCTPMGVNARGVAQCANGHGDYPDACDEAAARPACR